MEEERRLCYVGMTRAREELQLIYASSRVLYGGVQHNPPSRFLSEIDGQFNPDSYMNAGLQTFEQPARNNNSALDEPTYVLDLNEGDGVRHKLFGEGTVMEIEGENAAIYFKGKGVKKLNIAFAPLEKLG